MKSTWSWSRSAAIATESLMLFMWSSFHHASLKVPISKAFISIKRVLPISRIKSVWSLQAGDDIHQHLYSHIVGDAQPA